MCCAGGRGQGPIHGQDDFLYGGAAVPTRAKRKMYGMLGGDIINMSVLPRGEARMRS